MFSTVRWMGALLLLVVSLAGCQDSGGGDGGVLTATPVDPSGQWTVTDTETRNTCSPGSPVDTRDVLLALSSAQVAWQDEGDVCDASPDFPYANNQITGATHQFVGNDGCTYTESFAGTVQFTENNFSGSYRRTYSRSGVNCTDYPDGCEVRATTAGARCEGCYGGCL